MDSVAAVAAVVLSGAGCAFDVVAMVWVGLVEFCRKTLDVLTMLLLYCSVPLEIFNLGVFTRAWTRRRPPARGLPSRLFEQAHICSRSFDSLPH